MPEPPADWISAGSCERDPQSAGPWQAQVAELLRAGFEGGAMLRELLESRGCSCPKEPGVYVIVRATEAQAEFLDTNPAGRHCSGRLTEPVELLGQEWNRLSSIVYIGKAGHHPRRHATLRTRVGQLLRFGDRRSDNHRGGSRIWQIVGAWEMRVFWRVLAGLDPAQVENEMIHEHSARYQRRPFANKQPGCRAAGR